jgi:cobalt-zinc-cadmium efflux system outer membrane protein
MKSRSALVCAIFAIGVATEPSLNAQEQSGRSQTRITEMKTGASAAQNHDVVAQGLTLAQLIDIAVQDSKDLQAARYVEAKARARLVQAGLYPNPRLDVGGSTDSAFKNEGEYTASVGLSQQFPVAGRIARQQDVARVDIASALAEISEAERKLAGDVATRFYRIVALNRQIEARDKLIEVDRRLVDVARNRFRAAEVSELDVNAGQLDLLRLNQERILLVSERITQLSQLDQLLGRPETQPLVVNDSLPTIDVLPSLADQQRDALNHRPDLRSAMIDADRARADRALASAESWEDWTVRLSLDRNRLNVTGLPRQPSDNSIGLNLTIPLPVSNRNQGRIAETLAGGAQADARISALELAIKNEVATGFAEVTRLRQATADYQRDILPVSERNVRLAQQGYRRGLVSIVEVVQAERQQGDLNIAYLNTLDQYLQAFAKLRTATAAYLNNQPSH